MAAHARDVHALVADELGHERCVTAGGDLGGLVLYDLSLRFDGFVQRQVLFNTVPPILPEEYEPPGYRARSRARWRQAADYFMRQARDADGLAAELDTEDKRRRYVAEKGRASGPARWGAVHQRGRGVPRRAVRRRRTCSARRSRTTNTRAGRAR